MATEVVGNGLIVWANVIAMTDEDEHLLPSLADVQDRFELDRLPAEVLADA